MYVYMYISTGQSKNLKTTLSNRCAARVKAIELGRLIIDRVNLLEFN